MATSEFPTPEDEFEMMYADEFDLMNEMDNETEDIQTLIPNSAQGADLQKAKVDLHNLNNEPRSSGSNYPNEPLSPGSNYPNEPLSPGSHYSPIISSGNTAQTTLEAAVTSKKRLFPDDDLGFSSDVQLLNSDTYAKRKKLSVPMVDLFEELSKKKSEYDPDLVLIDQIVSHRKLIQANFLETTAGKNTDQFLDRRKQVTIHRRIPHGDFQSITTTVGQRYYLDLLKEEEFYDRVKRSVGESQQKLQLLARPYGTVLMDAHTELALLKSREDISANISEQPLYTDSDSGIEDDTDDSKELWVNKYRPRSYLDLLSDESTNRTVLHWMKLWDKVVFGRERKVKLKDTQQNQVQKRKDNKPWLTRKTGPEVSEEFDEFGRPEQKVLLLSGPPGLGKTTLAHIIAKHAGYNVVEMNASDDRSVDVFKSNLENATSMKAVFGKDKRPNCLIIDEIDGAPAPSINLLVNVIQGKKLKAETKKTKKKEDNLVLRRPVICICNDLYTPALRPLRQIAFAIQFPPTQSARLAQRLHSIARRQKLKTDLSLLMALCNKTENDIRSCLSVLQFIRSTVGELRLLDLEGVSVGQKDYQRSLFTVWNDIFTIPRPKRQHAGNRYKSEPTNNSNSLDLTSSANRTRTSDRADVYSISYRYDHVLKSAHSCGEFEKLNLGWFENYLQIKFKHTHLEPVVSGLDWATFTDILQTEVNHHQNWKLNSYVPYAFVAYHFLFSSHVRPKLQYPTQYSEISLEEPSRAQEAALRIERFDPFQHIMKLNRSKNLISMVTSGMAASTLLFCPVMSLIEDIMPYLTIIIQPQLRPVNAQLYSSHEKQALISLVDTMIAYNLTYQQERTPDGQYSFRLEPNIEELTNFPNMSSNRNISYSSKQLIAREVELEKVRRSEKYFEKQERAKPREDMQSKKSEGTHQTTTSGKLDPRNSADPAKPLPNHLQKLEAKKHVLKESSLVARDFFGRVKAQTETTKNKDNSNKLLISDIWFKFKEGYSNAVRRPIRIREFFRE